MEEARRKAEEGRKAAADVHELIQKGYFALRNGFPRFSSCILCLTCICAALYLHLVQHCSSA